MKPYCSPCHFPVPPPLSIRLFLMYFQSALDLNREVDQSVMPAAFGGGKREAFRIVAIYLIAGAAWILLSDEVLWRFFPAERWGSLSLFKGLLYVAATGALLTFLLLRSFGSLQRSQQAVEESRRRFQLFMDHLPVAAFLKDKEGRYVYLNRAFRERFASDPQAPAEHARALFEPELAERFAKHDLRVLETGEVHESEISTMGADGWEHWLVRRFPIPTGVAGETLIGGFAMDFSDHHRLEEQLRQAGKMEALGRVAGGMAHDFNNMLTVVNGYASMLSRELGDTPNGRKAREIQLVGEKAAELTRQLLAFSRKNRHHPERLELNRAIKEMEPVIHSMLPESIEMVLALDPALPPVQADHAQVQQILLNLALNARDALPGGGMISFETRKFAQNGGQQVQLTVRDNGIGMDAAVRERIFEPFFTTKDPGKGIGLGLATVYGAVRQNGGTIEVESEPGRGAVFTIVFPAAPG
jgi:two-component system, cell cycle sensor histidine kinase and response regulator CckA